MTGARKLALRGVHRRRWEAKQRGRKAYARDKAAAMVEIDRRMLQDANFRVGVIIEKLKRDLDAIKARRQRLARIPWALRWMADER